jgi:virulence-associated protein VagC
VRFIIFLLCLPALLSCGGSSASKKETPKPFTFSIQHAASAVGNQPIDITLVAENGYSITSSSLEYETPLVVKMTKMSETQYQLLVPEVYSDETLTFTIKAANAENTEISQNGEIALSLNMRPLLHSLSQPVNAVLGEPFLLEFSVEDEHEYLPVELELNDLEDEVKIERMSDTSFTITPLAINSTSIHFEATVSDVFGQVAQRGYVLPAGNEQPYFEIYNHGHRLLKGKKAHLYVRDYNLPENVEMNDIHWEQISGIETVTNRVDGELYVSYPNSYSAEPLVFEASITLTDRTHYRLTESITLIEDKPYVIEPLEKEMVKEQLAAQQAEKDTDLNGDGLQDIITIDNGIIYAQIQNSNGTHEPEITIGKVTFHETLSYPDLPEIHAPRPENLTVYEAFLFDVNKDGIRDLIFSGSVHYPEAAITDSLAGWVKGISANYFYGDYISWAINASSGYSFNDINNDGLIDFVYYDSYTQLSGPFVDTNFSTLATKLNTVRAGLPFSQMVSAGDGYYGSDNQYNFFRLIPETNPWMTGIYNPGDYVMLTVNGFSADDNYFDYGYTLTLSPNARRIYLLDFNDDGSNDIVIETTEGEYQHITVIE